MTVRSHTATRQVWVDRIERFDRAGQSVAQFCAGEGVSPASFYQSRRKFRSVDAWYSTLARFVPVTLPAAVQPESKIVMCVDLPGGVRIRFEVIGPLASQVVAGHG
jgi:hypothetical protein